MKKGDEKMTTVLFCAIVAVTNTMGTIAVDTHGARVVSYVLVGGEEGNARGRPCGSVCFVEKAA